MIDGNEMKARQRATWTAGDFARIAERIVEPSIAVLDRVGVGKGTRILDVACGTGNAVIPAAQRGAEVTGLDLTPKLLEEARVRAAVAGVEVALIEGDAEELPFKGGSFERVISVFGTMFAPDHQRAAAELLRVCGPGGKVGFCAWTPQGLNGKMFGLLGSYMPPPPAGFQPPVLWGDEDHVRGLLSSAGAEPVLERRSVEIVDDSVEGWLAFSEVALGPFVMAKAALEPQGRWDEARAELVSLYESHNESSDGSLRAQSEYLMTTVQMPE